MGLNRTSDPTTKGSCENEKDLGFKLVGDENFWERRIYESSQLHHEIGSVPNKQRGIFLFVVFCKVQYPAMVLTHRRLTCRVFFIAMSKASCPFPMNF